MSLDQGKHRFRLTGGDRQRLDELRAQRPARNAKQQKLTRGEAFADFIAEIVGSWRFIIVQTVVLGVWIAVNVSAAIAHWDPYPFILLNLILSFQATYAAPIIMMSQNRQAQIDRRRAEQDYRINIKAELEIELLHNKVDAMREQEILRLLKIIERLSTHLAPHLLETITSEDTGKDCRS